MKVEIRSKNSKGIWIRTRKNTGVKVNPKYWTGKPQKWISRSDAKHLLKNSQLSKLIDGYSKENFKADRLEFIPFTESFIQLTEASKKVTYRRIQDYKNTVRILLDFEAVESYPLKYETIDIHFISKFLQYLERNGHSQNNRRKILKMIKRFLRVALNEGHHSNLHFTTDAWTVKEVLPDNIYLNASQIEDIRFAEIPEHLNRIRDKFILGCNVGLRFSDLSKLDLSNVVIHEGRSMIRVIQGKTGELVVIPINSTVQNIIDKYGGFPESTTAEYFNRSIKEIARAAGLEVWEQVSSHTMRRSFATNAYIAKVPAQSIMKITGHKTEASFLRYIRITKEENAQLIGDHPFFS